MVPDFEVRLARGFATPRILIVLLQLSKASQLMNPPLDTNMTLTGRRYDIVTDAPDVNSKSTMHLMRRVLGRARTSLSSRRTPSTYT